MTKFTGPLIVGFLDSDTTAATIDASGSATFTGTLDVTERATFLAAIRSSSSAIFQERVQVGDSGQRGTAVIVQQVTIGQATTAGASASLTLPNPSNIVDIHVDVEIPFATGAGVTAAAVHVSASGLAAAMAIFRVSASTTRYGLYTNADTFTGSQLRNFTPGVINAYVSIVGSPTAMDAGQAMLTVSYIPG